MKKPDIEIVVGLFICIGLLCMAYTSVKLGKVELFNNDYYPLKAAFTSASGLKEDTNVEISGVRVGKVKDIKLENYQAIVTMLIQDGVEVQDDAIASIKTNGILGEKYIEILPGGSPDILGSGGMILDTEPPFDLLSLLKKFVVDNE
jgi:phospholipid/cholesterol/gamma-HCH transport system substrate-binding protein